MITPEQVRKDILCLRKAKENVGDLLQRKHAILAKSLIVMHKSNPVIASRLADEMVRRSEAALSAIEMQTVARFTT